MNNPTCCNAGLEAVETYRLVHAICKGCGKYLSTYTANDIDVAYRAKMAARAGQRTWSRAQATSWARSLTRWPGRRFRVDSPTGNSGLMTRGKAVEYAGEHGGDIVEMIPSKKSMRELR